MSYKYIFGPIPSRRLGISLGVDLVDFKVCSFNCVFCECGKTNNLTIERKDYIPCEKIISELKEYFKTKPELDFVTLTGSGEPTLNTGIEKIIDFMKKDFPQYKVAVLTNGTLLWDDNVVKEIKNADLIKISLNAITESAFKKITNCAKNLDIKKVIKGIIDFRKKYSGEIWLEIFIVPGINDNDKELELLKNAIMKMKPDKIHLNTLDRPAEFNWVKSASHETLNYIKEYFKPLNAEIVAKFKKTINISDENIMLEEKVVAILKRRPCTKEDIHSIFDISKDVLDNVLENLKSENKVIEEKKNRGIFFVYKELQKK
jgi:wyosine [tRNA(Phe)-imidazoG37] synthetase (radical SAM superfamily)